MNKEYDITKEMVNTINEMGAPKQKRTHLITESNDSEVDAIAITDEPRFGSNALTNQISAFRQAVYGGAKFGKANPNEPKSNPLVYFPKTGNLVFCGSIPSLADLKFQFSLNDTTDAPYIFVDGLALTDETLTILNKIRGFYKNWKDEWFSAGDLLEKLSKDDSNR